MENKNPKTITMKPTILLTVILITSIITLCFCCYKFGQRDKQHEIEDRAKDFDTECINESQLEIIIFGEVQL